MELILASIVEGALEFFVKGGFFMAILLVVSIVAGTVIILRSAALRSKGDPLAGPCRGDRAPATRRRSRQARTAHPAISVRPRANLEYFVAALWVPSRQEAGAEAVQTRARHEVARLESGLIILEITTGIAPLLGLLGTLSGLVGIFAAIGTDPVAVARGIAEALNTTIVGLAVASAKPHHFQLFPTPDRSHGRRGIGVPRGRPDCEVLPTRGLRLWLKPSPHEVLHPQAAGSIRDHCFVDRHPGHLAHFFHRHDNISEKSAAVAD